MNWNPCQGLGLRTIGMVASALADDYRIKVLVTGDTACTCRSDDGNTTVVIPAVDYDDPDYLTLIRGYIDHEAGHVRFTDYDKAAQSYRSVRINKKARVRGLANIYEDVLVERKMGDYYAGCKSNFRRLALHLFGNADVYTSYEKADGFGLVAGYILHDVRSQVYPELETSRNFIRQCMEEIYPGLADDLDTSVLSGVLDNIVSTEGNIDLAIETDRIIDKYLRESLPENTTERGGETTGGGEQDGTQKRSPIEENLRSLANTGDDEDVADEVSVSRRTASCVNSTVTTEIASSLGKTASGRPMNLFNSDGSVSASKTSGTGPCTIMLSDALYGNALRVSCALDAQLQALLQTFVQNRGGAARTGKLDTRKLSRLSVNNPNVFNRVVERQGVSTDVILLVDASGSMDVNGKIDTATSALYAVLRSLRKIKGVRSSAYAFGADDILEVISPEQRLTRKVGFRPGGGTYCGEALMAVATRFSSQHYDRRVILMLTDGETYNQSYFTYVLHRLEKAGVIVLGVGIQHSALARYINNPDRYAEVHSLPELVPELFRLLRVNLVRRSL